MKKGFWKKGDKVVRVMGWQYGFGDKSGMGPGDVATLLKDQEYIGDVTLKEYPGMHDTHRIRRLSDYPDFTAKELTQLYSLVKDEDVAGTIEFIRKKVEAKKLSKSTN